MPAIVAVTGVAAAGLWGLAWRLVRRNRSDALVAARNVYQRAGSADQGR